MYAAILKRTMKIMQKRTAKIVNKKLKLNSKT